VEAARICTACGIQFPPSAQPPRECPICADYRQFVPRAGQRWTTLEELRRDHRNAFQQLEPGLIGFSTTPEFAIGQRALLVRTPAGNVLWDCVSLIDEATVEIVKGLGGLRAIAARTRPCRDIFRLVPSGVRRSTTGPLPARPLSPGPWT